MNRSSAYNTCLIALFLAANFLSIYNLYTFASFNDVFDDDAYYYIISASNYLKYGFYTFDSINPTNGFHPLFVWIETFYLSLVGIDHDPHKLYQLIIILISSIILLLILGVALYAMKAVKNAETSTFALVSMLTVTYLLTFKMNYYFNGMESVLILAIGIPLMISLFECKFLPVCLQSILLVATRLDTILYFLPPLFAVFCMTHDNAENPGFKGIRVFLKLLIPSILFILTFGIYNYIEFGHFVPIHGLLKSSFPSIHPQFFHLVGKDQIYVLALSVIGSALLIKRRNASAIIRRIGLSLGGVTVVYLISFFLFQKWAKPIPPWYFSPLYLTSVGCFFIGLANIISEKKLIITTPTLLLISITYSLIKYDKQSEIRNLNLGKDEIVTFLKTLPKDKLFAYTDAGRLSFWSERNIVNLDGLINNFEYQKYLKDKNILLYLKKKKINYLIAGVWDRCIVCDRNYELMYNYRVSSKVFEGNYDILSYYLYSYLYNQFSDEIKLPRSAEIWRSSPYEDVVRARHLVFDLSQIT